MERRNHEEHIKRLEVSFLLGNYYSLLFLHGYLQLAFFLFLLFCHYCSILFLFFIFLINYLIPLILCSGMGYLPCLFFIKPSCTFSCYSPSELICRGIGLSLRRSFRSSETMFVFWPLIRKMHLTAVWSKWRIWERNCRARAKLLLMLNQGLPFWRFVGTFLLMLD